MVRNRSRTRDHNTISNQRLRYTKRTRSHVPSWTWRQPTKTLYEDRRQWHPEGSLAPARSYTQTRHRLKVYTKPEVQHYQQAGQYTSQYSLPSSVGFTNPSRVLICVRRKIRREVMHALRKTGIAGQNKPHYNEYSSVNC